MNIGCLFIAALAVAAAPTIPLTLFGPVADRLGPSDQARIASTAADGARRPWLLETSRSQVLPETWYVRAYLTPRESSSDLRRGTLAVLEGRVRNGRVAAWRVTERGQWAQVPLPGGAHRDDPTEAALDRPFTVEGAFSSGELAALVRYVRSSPRAPVERSIHSTASAGTVPWLDGTLPIVSVERAVDGSAIVWVAWRMGSSFRATLTWQNGKWAVVEVVPGGIA